MSRLMSVAYTEAAVLSRIKRVTRRAGWWETKTGRRILTVGETVTLCRKVMGRKADEPLVRLCDVVVLDVRREKLGMLLVDPEYGAAEVALEGFPGMDPAEFVQRFFVDAQGITPDDDVTRVEWRYLAVPPGTDEALPGLDLATPASLDDAALSADRRRTARQQQQVHAGRHPLTGGPLHPDASTDRDRTSGTRDPFTCGSCVHRVLVGHHTATYPKCDQVGPAGLTHSAATDVRAWWPACPAYSPTDGSDDQ